MTTRELLGAATLVLGIAGCGPSPCEDWATAVDKAAKVSGCEKSMKHYVSVATASDGESCDLSDGATAVKEAEAACFNAVKSCDVDGWTSLGECLDKANH
jgi:hypothetical protein